MAEDPTRNDEQQPTTPEEPQEASTGDEPSSAAQPAQEVGAVGEAGTDAAGETPTDDAEAPGQTPPAAEAEAAVQSTLETPAKPGADGTPDESAGAADTDVSADEVDVAMQEMLEASEKAPADGVSDEARGATGTSVSADEVNAAMQEMLAAAEQPKAEAAAGEAAGAGGAVLDASGREARPPNATPFEAPDFSAGGLAEEASAIDLLDDVELDVKIELGRTDMYIEDVLGLTAGSVVQLDKAAGDPVDIFINDRLVARGEVLVLNDNFCVRINDILSPVPELEREK